MDETSTSSTGIITEKLIRTALKNASYGTPSEKTLDYLRNFAASIRIVGGLPGESGIFSMN